ncbi:hypothetical protein KR074_006542 [Drosophila pseudoananassae]|nr:hypothetical protein KR074_006542 [Drosophila pseudoananassae]
MKPKQKTSALPLATGNLMLLAMLMGLLVASIQAIDQKSVKPSAAAPPSSRDPPIYIDDDSLEGSGGRGGIHEDLEKDPDYSGSGFGPDDEDAEPDHHSHGSHNSQHSQNGGGGGASINSKHNSNDFSKNGKNSNSDIISSRYNNNNNHNQIDNSQNINLNNNNNNNNHQTNSGTIIGSSTTANNNHNININSQNGIISGSEIGGHSTGINSIAAHTPTQPSSTISTPTTANWNTTTSTTTTTATPTTTSASSSTTTTTSTTTAATNNNNGPTNSISGQKEDDTDIFRQPEMPTFDPHVDTEGSGDSPDDDDDDGDFDAEPDNDNDNGDDDYAYPDRTIDGPGTRTDDDVKPEDEIPTNNHDFPDFDKDTIDLDEDIKKEDVVPDVGGVPGGAVDGVSTRTDFAGAGGNSNVHALDPNTNVNSQPSDTKSTDHRGNGNEVVIMSEDDRTSSFFSQPGILAAVIGGAVVGLLCAILVVMFIVYRMRKKDEGSYALDEPKRSPANNSYAKNANNREFYA